MTHNAHYFMVEVLVEVLVKVLVDATVRIAPVP